MTAPKWTEEFKSDMALPAVANELLDTVKDEKFKDTEVTQLKSHF